MKSFEAIVFQVLKTLCANIVLIGIAFAKAAICLRSRFRVQSKSRHRSVISLLTTSISVLVWIWLSIKFVNPMENFFSLFAYTRLGFSRTMAESLRTTIDMPVSWQSSALLIFSCEIAFARMDRRKRT
jgi:hypothetical protein